MMRDIGVAYGRALLAQMRPRMLLLSAVPFVLSLGLWGVILFFGMNPVLDALHTFFTEYDLFPAASSTLSSLGLSAVKAVVVPLLAVLLLLPLMIITALVFMGLFAMPAIVNHAASRFPALERKEGGSLLGGAALALGAFLVFVVVYLVTLPLYAVPPLAVLVHAFMWGWLTYRVVTYDALASHASSEERQTIMKLHRKRLLSIGMVSGAAGAIPGLAWVGGAVLNVVLFPVLAALSIWLYVLVFFFTGLWFTFYCLQALEELRAGRSEVT